MCCYKIGRQTNKKTVLCIYLCKLLHFFSGICYNLWFLSFTTFTYFTTHLHPLVVEGLPFACEPDLSREGDFFSASCSSSSQLHYKIPMNWLSNSLLVAILATRDFISICLLYIYFNISVGHCQSAMALPSTTAKQSPRCKHDEITYISSASQKYFMYYK